MSNKVSKAAINRVEVGRGIVSLVAGHKELLLKNLDGRMGLDRAGWEVFLNGQIQELSKVTEELWDTSIQLAHERSDDSANRLDRDRCVNELMEKLSNARGVLDSISSGLSQRYGLIGELSRVPATLTGFSYTVMENLRNANQSYTIYGVKFSTVAMADEIGESCHALQSKLDTVSNDKQTEEGLVILRDRVVDEWEKTYMAVGGFLEVMCELIGESKLAKRVRPSSARAAGRDGNEEKESQPKTTDSGKNDDTTTPPSDGSDEPPTGT